MEKFIKLAFLFFVIIEAQLLFGVGEKTIILGSGSGWEAVESRSAVVEISHVRPQPVLALAASFPSRGNSFDLYLSFDEADPGRIFDREGRWQVSVSSGTRLVDASLARSGNGAIRFSSGSNPGTSHSDSSISVFPGRNSIFSPGSRINDFSIEFWLFPLNLENNEQIINWSSSVSDNSGAYIVQRMQCTVLRNRLSWDFFDFFTDPAGANRINISFSGSRIIPKGWSHHLVRFNSDTGLVEYLVDGRLEAVSYSSTSSREGGEVWTPITGENGRLILGGNFSGFLDEFQISGTHFDDPVLARFPKEGRIQTGNIDLGSVMCRIQKIEASGGRTNGTNWNPLNSFSGSGNLRFTDYSEIQLFYRISNHPYNWDELPWIPVRSGEELSPDVFGRYIQIAADFYSSGNGEMTPYLDQVQIVYRNGEMPRPPAMVIAEAKDGAVELSWRSSVSANAGGYLVYFGSSQGEYFGTAQVGAEELSSPIDAGGLTWIRIEGLKNGVLYYFVIATYDNIFEEAGDFSREVAARPLRGY